MSSGLPNVEKAARRKAFARREIGRKELLEAEVESYHGPGTCTFYGTANSNQMLMEVMGLLTYQGRRLCIPIVTCVTL